MWMYLLFLMALVFISHVSIFPRVHTLACPAETSLPIPILYMFLCVLKEEIMFLIVLLV